MTRRGGQRLVSRAAPRRAGLLRRAPLLLALALGGCGAQAVAQTTLPAPAGAPPADLTLPSGTPKAVVILVRGGGWAGPDPKVVAQQQGAADALAALGFAVVNPDYRAGARGLTDLLARYDQTRARFPDRPICLFGQSAGGHLALVVAARRADVACVISDAGPTDLTALTPPTSDWARTAFGERLAALSPVRLASRIHARVLQVAAENDTYVPIAQVRALDERLAHGTLTVLPQGATPWIHSSVDAGALARASAAQTAFLDDEAAR